MKKNLKFILVIVVLVLVALAFVSGQFLSSKNMFNIFKEKEANQKKDNIDEVSKSDNTVDDIYKTYLNNRAKATECKLIKYIGYDIDKKLNAINTFYIADSGKLYVTFGISNSRLNNVLDLNDEADLELYNMYKGVIDKISEYEAKSEKMSCDNPEFTGELNGEDLKAYYTGMDNVVDIDIFDNEFATKEVMITTKDGKHYTLDSTINTTGEIKFNEIKYDSKNIIKVEDLLVGDSLYTRYIDISGNYVE